MAADTSRVLRPMALESSFEARSSASPRAPAPPPQPSPWAVFKVMLRKHLYIARKRRRLLTSVWPALLYSGVSIALFYAFGSISDPSIRAIILAIIVPVYLVLAIMGVQTCAIVEIVTEKESKMKVIQEIYGLSTAMYWASWLAYFLLASLVCIVVLYAMLTAAAPIFQHSNPGLLLGMLLVSYLQQFEFAAISAVFFSKTQTATAFAGFMNLILLLGSTSLQGFLRDRSRILWYLASLLPTVNVYSGLAAAMWLESGYVCDEGGACHRGLRLQTLSASEVCLVPYGGALGPCGVKQEIFQAGSSLLMMLVDLLLYAALAWWLDGVWQGEFGAAKPFTFCLQPEYMCPKRRRRYQPADSEGSEQRMAMSIRNLRKVFKGKAAVDDMSLDLYFSEIFALLGHNGAGKTTAINCVVGLIPMTSGHVTVNGCDVTTDLASARRQLSICPQDNPLYDVFTVRQHLVFFANLRGVSEAFVSARIHDILSALGMPEKVDDLCTSLSGGQKRRLWVATALLGESPLVFLDEPTSGLDPSSRRELWDMLLQMKASGRSIMFTTHYLEEADLLADRKAVVARGRVRAVGTSRDLKMQFGIGYHLQVDLAPGDQEAQEAELLALVCSHVPSAKAESTRSEERAQAQDATRFAKFTLPFNEVARFGPLLTELDRLRSGGDGKVVKDYSLAMTSLEEVFMALGEQAEREAGVTDHADFRDVGQEMEDEQANQHSSEWRGTKAMLIIRLRSLLGNRRSLNSVFFVPTLLNVLAFALSDTSDFQVAIYPSMAFGISVITFTLHLIQDKQWKCKYVALSQGLAVRSYWAGSFLTHYLALLPQGLIIVASILAKKPPKFYGAPLPLILIEVIFYPIGLLLYAYNFSLMFSTVEIAVKVLPMANIFLGTAPTICIAILPMQGVWPDVVKVAHLVMSALNPVYALPGMLAYFTRPDMADLITTADYFTSVCAAPLYLGPVGWLLFAGHLLWQDLKSYSSRPGDFQAFDGGRKDEDVLREEARIASMDAQDDLEAACYQNLSHTYRTKVQGKWLATHAVRGISLGVRRGECFGLLGPNGAGKTTTLAVLTGEVRPPTAGRVTIFGHDVASAEGLVEAYQLLGVCPQVDPLWETITGREHLRFYGRVKGVPEAVLEQNVSALLHRLGFDAADGDKQAGQYSGGMKRKLSLGIALMGHRQLLFLDEPSAAVDAGAKRHLWKVIKMRRRSQTVVLTTHSMEEAEALCDRIAIQVKGQLRCLGTPNHIKSKYGSGYQLEIFHKPSSGTFHVAAAVSEGLISFVQQRLSPEARLLEHHGERYLFQLPPLDSRTSLTLGRVFSELHANMEAFGILEYSLMQPSLEQVFVRFAREQEEAEGGTELLVQMTERQSLLPAR